MRGVQRADLPFREKRKTIQNSRFPQRQAQLMQRVRVREMRGIEEQRNVAECKDALAERRRPKVEERPCRKQENRERIDFVSLNPLAYSTEKTHRVAVGVNTGVGSVRVPVTWTVDVTVGVAEGAGVVPLIVTCTVSGTMLWTRNESGTAIVCGFKA